MSQVFVEDEEYLARFQLDDNVVGSHSWRLKRLIRPVLRMSTRGYPPAKGWRVNLELMRSWIQKVA